MTGRPFGLGSLGRRLLLAFVLVAGLPVLVITIAALIGVGRGLDVLEQTDRQEVAVRASSAATQAYADASGWDGADLGPVTAVADAAGARLVVLDATGTVVGQGQGSGGRGMGQGAATMGGPGVATAPVEVDGTAVGSVRLVFGSSAGSRGRDVAWTWIVAAAVVALAMAVLASWVVTRMLTGPLDAMTSAARGYAAGNKAARAGLRGPGELGELSRAFDAMAETVSRSERDQHNLTADVAHELRTPLAALQAGLEELRDGLAEPTPEGLAALHDQALRLGRVVADLAELSAAESTRDAAPATEVDLVQVAEGALAGHDAQLRAAGLVVHSDVTGPVVVRADVDRLHQAVGNVLANAARYCRPDDRVELVVRAEGRHGVLEVRDSGPGIPPDELPFIFHRLWRGRAARRIAGSGIGLAVARQVVELHAGTITAESTLGTGTTITIRLPLSRPPAHS